MFEGGSVGVIALRFNVLGPIEVWRGDVLVPVPAGRSRLLLAILLLRANQPVTADELVDRLWNGEVPNPDRAKATLHMVVRRLRQALGDANVVRTTTGGYLADLPPHTLDLHEFRDLAARGRFAEALALWRGTPLSDVPSDSLHHDEVELLLEERLGVLEHRFDAELAAGRAAGLVGELRSLTKQHPLRERFWVQLMTALRDSGRRPEALTAYQEMRTVLATELGVEPGSELRALHAALLTEDDDSAAPPARLRDHLPRDLPDFTGRAEELAAVVRGAERGLVCAVDGMAGVGKTAFAVHAAHLLSDRYPDGRFYIDLHGYTEGRQPRDPHDALAVLLYSLGVPRERVPVGSDERVALWRSEMAGLRAVVVLDNAFDALQVRPLLPSSAGCLVIVTSRRRLVGLDGSYALSLPVLPGPVAVDLFRQVAGRATLEPAALTRLVELCGHLPLAIRLAAARLNHRTAWSAEYLIDRMRDERRRLREFAADDRDVASAFAVSYRTLDDVQRRVFRALGHHVGEDVDRYSGAALSGLPADVVDEVLGALVEVNLVEEPRQGRFRLHDLVRQYAQGTAEPDDAAVVRLLDYYLAVVKAGDEVLYPHRPRLSVREPDGSPELPGFDTAGPAVEWFEAERENIAAAVGHAARAGFDEHAWQLPYLLWGFYYHGGHVSDWISTHEIALDATVRLGADRARARILSGLAGGYWACGRNEEALSRFLEAHAAMEAGGEYAAASVLLGNICACLDHLGRHEEALEHAERGIRIQREQGFRELLPLSLNNAASSLMKQGRYEESIERYREAVEVCEQIGNEHAMAAAFMEVARPLSALGREDEALDSAMRALATMERLADATATAEAANVVAEIHRKEGRLDEALKYFRRTLGTLDQATIPWEHAVALAGMADVFDRRGDRAAAVEHRKRAIDLYARLDSPRAAELKALAEDGG